MSSNGPRSSSSACEREKTGRRKRRRMRQTHAFAGVDHRRWCWIHRGASNISIPRVRVAAMSSNGPCCAQSPKRRKWLICGELKQKDRCICLRGAKCQNRLLYIERCLLQPYHALCLPAGPNTNITRLVSRGVEALCHPFLFKRFS